MFNQKNLLFYYVNAQSIMNKMTALEIDVNYHKPDVIGITES